MRKSAYVRHSGAIAQSASVSVCQPPIQCSRAVAAAMQSVVARLLPRPCCCPTIKQRRRAAWRALPHAGPHLERGAPAARDFKDHALDWGAGARPCARGLVEVQRAGCVRGAGWLGRVPWHFLPFGGGWITRDDGCGCCLSVWCTGPMGQPAGRRIGCASLACTSGIDID